MQKSEVKTIAFKGIERINERINCNDGACEEIMNLRPEGNTWHNVGKRKQITNKGLFFNGNLNAANEYKIIIHPVSKDKYYIVLTNNKVALYDKDTENKIKYLDIQGKIIGISYLDNVLIVCTQDKKYYFLYDAQTQDYKAISFNNVSATVKARSNPLIKQDDLSARKYDYVGITAAYNTGLMLQYLPADLTIYRTRDKGTITDYKQLTGLSLSTFSDAVKSFLGTMEDNMREGVQNAKNLNHVPYTSISEGRKIFKGLSFYRVAFKLYDGSYVNYSNISYADTNGDDAFSSGSVLNGFPISFKCDTDGPHVIKNSSGDYAVYLRSIAAYNPFGTHTVEVDISQNLEMIQSLFNEDIIQSIDVFMTRPIFSVDLDKDINLTKTYAYTQISGNGPLKVGDEISAVACFEGVFPRNDDGIRQQLLNGTYFKVKSFSKTDVTKSLTGIFTYDVTYDDVKTLEANTTMPTPTTDNEVLFKDSYNYNQKQHLYNLFYNIFQGYDLPDGTDYTPGDFDKLINAINHNAAVDGLYYTVKGEYNGESFAFKHKINNPDSIVSDVDIFYVMSLPRLFSYPLNDKIIFGVYIFYQNGDAIKLFEQTFDNIFTGGNTDFVCRLYDKDEKYFVYNIKPVEFKYNSIQIQTFLPTDAQATNYDSHFKPLLKSFEVSDLKITSFNEILQTSNKNILQLTETDNPFVLPSAANYAFGEKDNEILAISSNSGLTTDRNFGTYPLYVFTTDGIYTMAVGSGDVAYSNIVQLNTTQIINKNVLNTPLGVMFLSKRGLCIINGRQIQCISDLVKGNPTITSDGNLNKLTNIAQKKFNPATFRMENDLTTILQTDALTPVSDDFLAEIKDSQLYYDEVHNEVCIVVKDKYTYVFNLSLNVFYKRSDYFQVDGKVLSTSQTTVTQGLIVLTQNKINLFSFDEEFSEDEDICKSVAIITKPFLLDTRHLKNIERIIFDMSWRDKDDFYLVLFGSKDGVNYNIVKKCIKKTNDKGKEHQDVYLDLVLSTVKYCFLCICSRNFYDTRIANTTFQFKQTANFGGIR